MKFQAFNDRGACVMETQYASCIPTDEQLSFMSKAGYKFKIDGKTVSAKKIKELRKDFSDVD